MSDQVYSLLQDQIFFWDGKPDGECLGNKTVDVPVNIIFAARPHMLPHNPQNGTFCHVITSCPENVVQDDCQVYDVAHHTSNILLAGGQEQSEHLVGDKFGSSLTCLDIHRKPNPRACLRIVHSSHYRQLNSLEMSAYNVIHLPRHDCATSWYG